MKSKVVLFSLVIVLLSSLLATGCAAEPPKPGEVIQLKYSTQNPETGFGPKNADAPWIADLEKVTNGRLKITPYYAQSLAKGPDNWQAIKSGIADLGWCFHGYWPAMTPLSEVITLPFLPFKSSEQASEILWKLIEKYPNMAKEWSENKLLLTFVTTPYYIITTKKQVKTVEDLKGLKLRVASSSAVEASKLLGIVPQTLPMPDCYENMQKGVIDGMLTPWESLYTFRLYEPARFWTYVPFHTGYFSQPMNWNTWNKLGPEVQKQVMSKSGLEGSKWWGRKFFDDVAVVARDEIKKQNITITEYTPPPAEIARFQEIAGKPVWDKWLSNMKQKGYTEAQNILNDLLNWAK